MKTNRLFPIISVLVLCLTVTAYQVQAQQARSRSTGTSLAADAGGEIDLTTMLAHARRSKPAGFSLMAESRKFAASGAQFSISPMVTGSGLPVTGAGILGRLTKWTGFTSSNSAIGDSTVYEDKNGNVGVGTDTPTSKLTVVSAKNAMVVDVQAATDGRAVSVFNISPGPGGGSTAFSAESRGAGSVGVLGVSSGGIGGIGVVGDAIEGDGVAGVTISLSPPAPGGPAGISGSGDPFFGGGLAGRFNGNVRIEKLFDIGGSFVFQPGDLSVAGKLNVSGTKNFKIDHPLDPENKYLYHASIESSEVLNLYSGNVRLDESGEGTVRLPDWFQAINRDFRYSLTPVGAPMPGLFVAEKVKGNTFKIAGGAAGSEVSWQVIGVRSDPLMRKYPFNVEEEKPERERGYYLNHDAYDLPLEKSVHSLKESHLPRKHIEELNQRRIDAERMRNQQPNQR